MPLTNVTGIARSDGDPRLISKGPSSLTGTDRLTRALGWFSVGLGLMEFLAPGPLARGVGLEGKRGLIRAYGARELASAIPTLSVDKSVGLAARLAGDMLDLNTLSTALKRSNPKRHNARIAVALVAGVTLLDFLAYRAVKAAHRRKGSSVHDYSERSGLPRGAPASLGLARNESATPSAHQPTAAMGGASPSPRAQS